MPDVPRNPAFDVGEMHRPAETLADTIRATVDLGHQRLRIAAQDDRVAVTTISGQGRIAAAEVAERAHDRRLGAVGQVRVAADHAGVFGESALDALFESADAQHLGEDPDLPLGVGYLYAHLISL